MGARAESTRRAGRPSVNTPTVPGEESILLRGLDAECLRQVISGFYRTAADAPLVGRMFVNEFTLDSERLDYLYEHYIAPTLQLMVPSIDRLVAAGRMAPVPMGVLFFAVVPPVSGMVEVPLARRPGRPEPASPGHLAAAAESLAAIVVNGLLATGATSRR